MANAKDYQGEIKVIAGESLDTFSKIAGSAKSQLNGSASGSAFDAFASINTWTSTAAVKNKEQISQDTVDCRACE